MADRWWFIARRAPGTLQPSIWIASNGPNTQRVCDCRSMLGARLGAFFRNALMWKRWP